MRPCARPSEESSRPIGQVVEKRPFDWLSKSSLNVCCSRRLQRGSVSDRGALWFILAWSLLSGIRRTVRTAGTERMKVRSYGKTGGRSNALKSLFFQLLQLTEAQKVYKQPNPKRDSLFGIGLLWRNLNYISEIAKLHAKHRGLNSTNNSNWALK